MKVFLKRIFKKKCTHKWYIDCRSNMVQLDDMGYVLRLCIVKCEKCGKYEQKWLDSNPQGDDVITTWVEN
jgi:hypothetical protein